MMVEGHLHKLSSALWQLQQSGAFCDTELITAGNVKVYAHASVLAASSSRLHSMLQQCQKGTSDSHEICHYQLCIVDHDIAMIDTLLQFIYTGELGGLTSLNGRGRDDLLSLCDKLGITVNVGVADSSSVSEPAKHIMARHMTEVSNTSHCDSRTSECDVVGSRKVNSNERTFSKLPVHSEVNYRTFSDDQMTDHSASKYTTCITTANDDLPDIKVQIDPEPAETVAVASENKSTQRRSAKVKRMRQTRTRPQLKDPLVCSSCKQTFSRSSNQAGDLQEQSCSHCRHPVTDSSVDLKPTDVIIKMECGEFDTSSGVDTSHEKPECKDLWKLDQFRQQRYQRKPATVTMTNAASSKSHRCSVCSRRCSTARALHQHERVHTETSSRPTVASCRTCGKKFRHSSYLRCHERLHDSGTKPYVCDVCGKGFIASSNLATHRRTHTGERPFACSICHKRFFQLCAVREHEKIHVGIKMFICDVCGKQFMTNAQLFNHSRTHGGEKSFECKVCKKRFYTNGDLVKHARIHVDKRPFVCDVCGKGFKYSSNLHGHSRIHTGSRPFSCETCGKTFTYSSHLTRHAKLHARNTVVIDEATNNPKEESVTPLSDAVHGVSGPTAPAILLVQPELLFGGQQLPTNILPGFTLGHFTTRLHN